MEIAPRITVDKEVRSGVPMIRGTRVPVDVLLGKMAGGMSPEEVALEYEITLEDVRAALAYAANSIAHEEIRALE